MTVILFGRKRMKGMGDGEIPQGGRGTRYKKQVKSKEKI